MVYIILFSLKHGLLSAYAKAVLPRWWPPATTEQEVGTQTVAISPMNLAAEIIEADMIPEVHPEIIEDEEVDQARGQIKKGTATAPPDSSIRATKMGSDK